MPQYEQLILSCPESFAIFPKSEIRVECVENSDFLVEGRIYNFSQLKCTTEMKPTSRRTGFHCGKKTNTEKVDIGYYIGGRTKFIDVYEVCLDKDKRLPIYAKQNLNQTLAGFLPHDTTWHRSDLVPYNYEVMYDCRRQNDYISNFLRKDFHKSDRCCFGMRQLVNPKDVTPGLSQIASYNYLNVIPQWSTCTNEVS